ncbi:MAG: hypothetical protein R3D62_13250 [Xanthobacteraceae bacterium]
MRFPLFSLFAGCFSILRGLLTIPQAKVLREFRSIIPVIVFFFFDGRAFPRRTGIRSPSDSVALVSKIQLRIASSYLPA